MSGRSDIPEFPDVNFIAQFLLDKKKFNAPDVGTLKNNPEFQVLRIIGMSKILTTEEIEAKFETSQSLSMLLSNLQADGLIMQSSDYRWMISDQFWDLLDQEKEHEQRQREAEREHQEQQEKLDFRRTRKTLYKRIADQLVDTGYVPAQHTVEDLFNIPEVEILAIIFENDQISTQDIEEKITLDSSVSLALSNLQADNLIKQNERYEWQLEDNLQNEINLSSPHTPTSEQTEDQESSYSIRVDQSKIIEHKQLLKALLDINYFPNKRMNEIVTTTEFEILNIINSNSPISSEEIENHLSQDAPLSLLLSNLSADDLISQTNDIRWVLAEDFRVKVSKVKVSQDEIMEQLKLEEVSQTQEDRVEIPDNDRAQSSTKSEPRLSSDFDKVVEPDRPINPLREILLTLGYIPQNQYDESVLMQIPEYEIMKMLAFREPLSSDEIDAQSHTSSVSLTLSNLAADGLIQQREADFKYELIEEINTTNLSPLPEIQGDKEGDEDTEKEKKSEELKKKKQSPPSKEITGKQPETTTSPGKQKSISSSDTLESSHEDKDYNNLRAASRKAGYISDESGPIEELLEVPEFEVLKLIGDLEPIDEQSIKDKAESVSPVLISRTLSKLEADQRIERNSDGTWEYTKSFQNLLVEDQRKEKARLAALEEKRRKRELEERLAAEKARREQFITLLRSEGIIEDETSQEQLMDIPEFEILWIIADSDEVVTEEEIKSRAKSTSPVLITRTINQLMAKGRIQKTLDGKYDISPDLKTQRD